MSFDEFNLCLKFWWVLLILIQWLIQKYSEAAKEKSSQNYFLNRSVVFFRQPSDSQTHPKKMKNSGYPMNMFRNSSPILNFWTNWDPN